MFYFISVVSQLVIHPTVHLKGSDVIVVKMETLLKVY